VAGLPSTTLPAGTIPRRPVDSPAQPRHLPDSLQTANGPGVVPTTPEEGTGHRAPAPASTSTNRCALRIGQMVEALDIEEGVIAAVGPPFGSVSPCPRRSVPPGLRSDSPTIVRSQSKSSSASFR